MMRLQPMCWVTSRENEPVATMWCVDADVQLTPEMGTLFSSLPQWEVT